MQNLHFNSVNYSYFDEISTRAYYVVSAGTEVLEVFVKITKVALAALTSSLFFGRSKELKNYTFSCWYEVLLAVRMLTLSLRGIFQPEEVVELKQESEFNFWKGHKLIHQKEASLSYAEKVAHSILSVSAFVEAGFCAAMAMVRSITAITLYPLGLGRSLKLPQIFVLQAANIEFHLLRMGSSALGILQQQDREVDAATLLH